MSRKKFKEDTGKKYNTIDDIDEYMKGVVAANASRRLPFMGN